MYHQVYCIALIVFFFSASAIADTGLCTGYPKTFNGKPCASTTRYWDGQMGACGCGTGNTSPFSWQWSKPTAAASAPIFGSGTWCGSGCGKCFKLTPTGVGASVAGKGATNTDSLVVKVTNLCPYGGNEEWCAMDVNTHDYDAHFDLMDYNMNGIITAQGWDNPEVTYEEVDCASNGYTDWNCQCASASSSPSTGATTTPTNAAVLLTSSPNEANNSPADATSVTISLKDGINAYWIGFALSLSFSAVEVMDSGSAFPTWSAMSYHGDQDWSMYYANPPSEMTLPLSLRFTSADGKVYTASNVISSWVAEELNITL